MNWNLFTYVERFFAALPAALKVIRVQNEAGFIAAVEELLEEGIHHLEINAINFRPLGETGLTAAMVQSFNRHGIRAHQEANANGHVDLYIENSFRLALLVCGETKVYRGPAYHLGGLAQVMDYATARCGFAFIIEYVRDRPVVEACNAIRNALDAALPENQQGPCLSHDAIQFALVSSHLHPTGRNIRITHAGASLPVP
jgi:hypothetical protein